MRGRRWRLFVLVLTAGMLVHAACDRDPRSSGAGSNRDIDLTGTAAATGPAQSTERADEQGEHGQVERFHIEPSTSRVGHVAEGPPCHDPSLAAHIARELPDLGRASGRIAFVCEGSIWTMRPDGSDHRPVVERAGSEENRWPRWLSESRLVFASDREVLGWQSPLTGGNELYLVNADGSDLERLTSYNLVPGSFPRAAPPGPVAIPIRMQPLAVAPSGERLALAVIELRQTECCRYGAILTLSSLRLERIAVPQGQSLVRSAAGFSWSPDGRRASIYVLGQSFDDPRFDDIILRDLESNTDTVLVHAGTGERLISLGGGQWSPRGGMIAFCGFTGATDTTGTVSVISAAGGSPRALATLPLRRRHSLDAGCDLSWSPDGRYLAIGAEEGIVVVEVSSGRTARIARGGEPAWGGVPAVPGGK